MQANDYLSLRSPILLCGIILMFFASAMHAQEKQQALMPGTYRLNLHETDILTPPQTWFQSRENIFVHKDSLNGLWLKVSRFKLVPFERWRLNTSGGKTGEKSRTSSQNHAIYKSK